MTKSPPSLSVVPSAYVTKMGFPGGSLMTEAAAGTFAFYTYALNNLYDPDFSGAGVQPIGFDQWAAFYTRFRVVSVNIRLLMVNVTNVPCLAGWVAHTNSTLTSSTQAWPMQRYSGSCVLQANTGGPSTHEFNISIPLWELLSLTKAQYMDEADYSHGPGSGPLRVCYFTTWTVGYGGVSSVRTSVQFTYSVQLSDPLSLAVS